jgi:hypothetical protein
LTLALVRIVEVELYLATLVWFKYFLEPLYLLTGLWVYSQSQPGIDKQMERLKQLLTTIPKLQARAQLQLQENF